MSLTVVLTHYGREMINEHSDRYGTRREHRTGSQPHPQESHRALCVRAHTHTTTCTTVQGDIESQVCLWEILLCKEQVLQGATGGILTLIRISYPNLYYVPR